SLGKVDLRSFAVEDMHRCATAMRAIGASGPSLREAAEQVVSYLFEELREPGGAGPDCPLVRLFRVVPCNRLSEELEGRAPRAGDLEGLRSAAHKCLVLQASRGVRPEWNDPSQSVNHRVIPLSSPKAVSRLPMISALLSQLEVPATTLFGPPGVGPDAD